MIATVFAHNAVDLAALAGLAGVTAWYLRGAARRNAVGVATPRRTVAFLAGVGVTLVAVAGPIPGWSEHLLWVHMVQHLLLTVVAAPLFALGSPVATLRFGLSPTSRSTVARWSRTTRRWRRGVGDPPPLMVATVVHIVLLWVWHAPWLYDLAVRNTFVHALEHIAFLGSAVWVWIEIVATARRNRRAQALATFACFALIVTGGVLGALLTFASRSVYEVYTGAGGLTALEDQQLAGALMWVPPSFVYAVVALRRFTSWLRRTEQELRAREQQRRATTVARPTADDPPRPASRP
ncbi:cytochrome c oxidase assembly protein [Nitriliruptor alkaliphilus]|uniref:cytochrome c oxidase assembly protein n=1 Tax=Nitriliruptor alkaliphilus TaxID=427918 RepID=UPI0006979CCD|nr:cytochrome c oxidase assembly protein [Nitriliruptor alkaliphilus]